MATAGTIMDFVHWVPREERLNGWVERWDTGLHYGLHVGVRTPFCSGSLFSRGSRLSPWLLFFWARGEWKGGHTSLVMCTGLAWVQSDATHTHTLTQNHYLKGVANQIASQSADQPCRSRHLSWRINSQSRGALGLYLVQVQTVSTCVCTQRTSLGWLNTPLVQRQNDKPQMMSEQV